MTDTDKIEHVIKLFNDRKPIKINGRNFNKVIDYCKTAVTHKYSPELILVFTPIKDYKPTPYEKVLLEEIKNGKRRFITTAHTVSFDYSYS